MRSEVDLQQHYESLSERMSELPIFNTALAVSAVGFQTFDKRRIGVILTPWCMNLVVLPAESDCWLASDQGSKRLLQLPSGQYEFIHNWIEGFGGFISCSLFSPMAEFHEQSVAEETADEVMKAIFDQQHLELTDRQIAQKEVEREQETSRLDQAPKQLSRRGFLTAAVKGRD